MNTRERMKVKARKLGTETIILFDGTNIFTTNKTVISYPESSTPELWKKYPIINYPNKPKR